MADTDASGKGDIKSSVESSASFVRPDTGEHPNTSLNPFGEFQHKEFDASYDHNPFTSVNPAGPSGGSKFIHPFMMERFIDDSGDTRLRIYGGDLYYTINSLLFSRVENYSSSHVLQILHQPKVQGVVKAGDVTGFTALEDDDGNDTVYKAIEYDTSDAYGDFYLQWSVVVSRKPIKVDGLLDSDDNPFFAFSSVTLYRTTVGGVVVDLPIGSNEVNGSGSTLELLRGTGSGSANVGTYYAKIGTSYDPDDTDTDSKTLEQVLFNHVYWSPLILSETE